MTSNARGTAVQLLDHYLCLALERSGGKPDRDTHAEIEEIVDSIIIASAERCKGYIDDALKKPETPVRSKLSAVEKSTLRLMSSLAIESESALMDAAPTGKDHQDTIESCERNIRSFLALRKKLLKGLS